MPIKNNIAILGDGLLGSEIHSQTGWDIISRKKDKFDITDKSSFNKPPFIEYITDKHAGILGATSNYNTIINCIAHTDTYSESKQAHWDVNLQGTKNLVDFCNEWRIKLIHISTDYIYSNSIPNASENTPPVHCATWYGYTKLVADALVQLESNNHLIVRTTHKSKPFPYDIAWENQMGNFDYVDIIASQIITLINKEATGVFNIGTELKTMYDLAKQTKPGVKGQKVTHPLAPHDVSMNTDKFNNFIK
jgi:dTDP-4-dehydrorhamnose reductase